MNSQTLLDYQSQILIKLKLIENQISVDTVCLFLKGASVEDELTDLQSYSTMVPVSHPSLSDPNGVVLELKYNW